MKVVCAWCKKVLKEGDEKNGISHGMCKDCYNKEASKLQPPLTN